MYYMELGGVLLGYRLRVPETARWFEWHMKCGDIFPTTVVFLEKELLERRRPLFVPGTRESYMEYRTLVEPTGRALAENGRFIFHSVAMKWRGYAWLFNGRSGTGKTTQYRNWEKMWPDEVEILCGDMPLLCTHEDGTVWVYPSPWNGSERWGFQNHTPVPLGGLVCLEQGNSNRIWDFDPGRKIRSIWHSFIGQADTERQIHARASFMDSFLKKYPVWVLENMGDEDSSLLMRQTLEDYLQRSEEYDDL